jgi:hypothetical protein
MLWRIAILPNNLTAPAKFSQTHFAFKMTASPVSLYSITAACFRTPFRCACFFPFCPFFVFTLSTLCLFCLFGRLGEGLQCDLLLIDRFCTFLLVNDAEVVTSARRLLFTDIAVAL